MANHLDLEEQEQLDQLKHFWAQYGNLITWTLIIVFGAFAAWNGWNWWQRSQAVKASALYDEVVGAVDARDPEKVTRALSEMKDRFGGSVQAAQAALLAAQSLFEAGKVDEARATLSWVAEQAGDESLGAVARLRLAGVLLEAKDFDAALKQLDASLPAAYAPLAADRRGDILLAQGKTEEAKAQYRQAWDALSERAQYRQLVQVKLASLGVDTRAANTESVK